MVLISNQAYAAEALNVRLVGHSDLHGREALQVVLKESYAYVGHLGHGSPGLLINVLQISSNTSATFHKPRPTVPPTFFDPSHSVF